MAKQVWRKPEAIKVSVKAVTKGAGGTIRDSCSEGFIESACS